MKNKSIITIILLVGFIINVHGQDSLKLKTPEGLGKEVFIAFKSNNFELFRSLLITETKYEFILNKIQATDSLKAVYRQRGIGAMKHLHFQAKQNFENIITTAKSNNINWETTEIIEIRNHPRKDKETERTDIVIMAKSMGVNFFIILNNCYKSDIWHIMDKVDLKM